MSNQIKAYQAAKVSDKAHRVFEYLLSAGPSTRKQIAAGAELSLSCVCGRVGELAAQGIVYTYASGQGNQRVVADPNPKNWEARAEDFTRSKQLDRVYKFAADFAPYLDATTTEGLRRVCRQIKKKPL